jgi:hypothetical protein
LDRGTLRCRQADFHSSGVVHVGSSRRRPVPELNFTDDVLAALAERAIESVNGSGA